MASRVDPGAAFVRECEVDVPCPPFECPQRGGFLDKSSDPAKSIDQPLFSDDRPYRQSFASRFHRNCGIGEERQSVF